jgi:glutaminyl-peptide cyclotransferase
MVRHSRVLFLASVFLAMLMGLGPVRARAGAPVLAATVVAAFPHDPEAYTQGLLFHDGYLYESTGLYGRSSLRRLVPDTGHVLARRNLPREIFGEGLALVGDRFYQLSWKEGRVFVWRATDFAPLGEFPLAGEGWGVCVLDGQLVVSDGSDRLCVYNPENFTKERCLTVTEDGRPVTLLNELETVSGTIWANVWGAARIAVIDPATGRVLAWVDCAALVPEGIDASRENVLNGIAWDPATGRIWVTGKRWPKVYVIKVPGLPVGGSR